MQNIIYRPIKKEDYEIVSQVLSNAFGLHRYLPNKKMLDLFRMQYLYGCLMEATYSQVAEENGKVIGVILGNAKKDYRVLQHLKYIRKYFGLQIRLKRYEKECAKGVEGYRDLHRIYADFLKKHKKEFDGVLTLFAINEESRGKGVGKHLLQGLLEYQKQHSVTHSYLYTDSTCNVGFYEHQGFRRLETEPLAFWKDGEKFVMEVYLYSYYL